MNNDIDDDAGDDWEPESLATDARTNATINRTRKVTKMNDTDLRNMLDYDDRAQEALRTATMDAAIIRHKLLTAAMESIAEGELPRDVLTLNVGKLRRILRNS